MTIYFDNAATTALSASALNAMLPYYNQIYGNPSSLHTMGQQAAAALKAARHNIADCLGCEDEEIIFTSGGSEADTQALKTAARIGLRHNKRHIISAPTEHHAILNTLLSLKKDGFEIELLPVDSFGRLSAAQVKAAIRPDTALVSVMYANNEIGTVNPIEEIGRICHEHQVLFHTDAVQAAGHLPIHVRNQHIDLLSISAHKFHGPKGVGLLYARKNLPLVHIIEGGGQEMGRRSGTENLPGIIGMAAALDDACQNREKNASHTAALRDYIISGILERIPHCILNGSPDLRLPGNCSFCFEDVFGELLLMQLDQHGICCSAGSACSSGSADPSHVLRAIGRSSDLARGSLRISLCETNTKEEADYLLQLLPGIIKDLRSHSPVWEMKSEGSLQFLT